MKPRTRRHLRVQIRPKTESHRITDSPTTPTQRLEHSVSATASRSTRDIVVAGGLEVAEEGDQDTLGASIAEEVAEAEEAPGLEEAVEEAGETRETDTSDEAEVARDADAVAPAGCQVFIV